MGLTQTLKIMERIIHDRNIRRHNMQHGIAHAHGCVSIELMVTDKELSETVPGHETEQRSELEPMLAGH